MTSLMDMAWRNPKYNADATIECEVEHPMYSWIPFTANPDDVEEHGRHIHAEILASGQYIVPYVPPTPAEARARMEPVSQRQMRLALLNRNIHAADIDAAIKAIVQPTEQTRAEIEFHYSDILKRLSSGVVQVLFILGFSEDQQDILWNEALRVTA